MSTLKEELVNQLVNKKYFAELELKRLSETNVIPRTKVLDGMVNALSEIAEIDLSLQLINTRYMVDPAPAPEPAVQQKAAPAGQTHGEG